MERRRFSRRDFLKFTGMTTGGLLLAACGGGPETEAPAADAPAASESEAAAEPAMEDNVLRWGHWDTGYIGKQFPWTMAGGVNHTPLVKMSHEGPFFRNAKLELEMNLAESAEYNDDFSGFTVKIREGIKWSDGEPVTAHDVWGTTLMAITPDTSASKGVESALQLVKGVKDYWLGSTEEQPEGLIVEDDYTLRVEMIEPWSDAIWNILGGQQTLPWHIYGKIFEDKEARSALRDFETPIMLDPELQIGTGPYVYEKGEKEVYMRYVKNPMYHGPEPQLDAVEFITYGSADACLVAFERGEVDVMATSDAAYVPSMAAVAGTTTYDTPDYYVRMLRYNWNQPYLNDVRVFRAIDMALDRSVLCAQVLNQACIAWRQYGPGTDGFDHNPYDPEEAKRLLEEAGWDPNQEIDLLTDYTDPLTAELLPAIAAMLGQVGIKATPKVLQGPALTEYYYNNNVDIWYDGSWGIPSVTVWPGQYDDPVWVDGEGNEYGEYADGLTPKGGNLMGFHPEWAQQALEEYRAASPERKSELLKMIQERTALEGTSWMTLARYNRWISHKDSVSGVDNPDTVLWNFDVFCTKSNAWTWSKA
jgi:peptide/nickel transport system substrate-binding protein